MNFSSPFTQNKSTCLIEKMKNQLENNDSKYIAAIIPIGSPKMAEIMSLRTILAFLSNIY